MNMPLLCKTALKAISWGTEVLLGCKISILNRCKLQTIKILAVSSRKVSEAERIIESRAHIKWLNSNKFPKIYQLTFKCSGITHNLTWVFNNQLTKTLPICRAQPVSSMRLCLLNRTEVTSNSVIRRALTQTL